MEEGKKSCVGRLSSSIAALWTRIRKFVIGWGVVLHFALGLLCFLPEPCVLWEVPGLQRMTYAYDVAEFAQTWRMFAPPSQSHYEIGYSLKFKDGWTKLLSLDAILEEQGRGRRILPRGYIRLANHLRHPLLKQEPLQQQPYFFHYFQQLSAFFLFGDGAVPGVQAVRFYSVVKGIDPFFEKDSEGKPLPKAADYNRIVPLYERSVDER